MASRSSQLIEVLPGRGVTTRVKQLAMGTVVTHVTVPICVLALLCGVSCAPRAGSLQAGALHVPTSYVARRPHVSTFIARGTSHVSTSSARRTSHVKHVARRTSHGTHVMHVAPGTSHVNTPLRFEFQQHHMGTMARVVLYARDAEAARKLADIAFARIAGLDARLSDYRSDSELMRLCARAGGPAVRVSRDLARVLDAAQRLARRSGGAFDITIGPVSRLWRRARAAGELPAPGELAAARRLVGYDKLELSIERQTVRLREPGMMLDLGGIGKGYAADAALAALRAAGAPAALVALGGDVAVGDPPPGKDGWQIAIAPLGMADGAGPLTSRLLRDAGISTSGDAEQFIERNGVRHSHVVDPSSGAAGTGRRGVTVIAGDATTSDALSTAVAVAGADRGLPLVDDTPGAAALFLETTATGKKTWHSKYW